MDHDFEIEFSSDDEVEAALDEIVNSVRDELGWEEQKPTMLNLKRWKQFQTAYAALRYMMKGKNVQISSKMYEPFKTMGSITAEGAELVFDRPEWFTYIARLADNTEVYPLIGNAVRMTFTFHGLTTLFE